MSGPSESQTSSPLSNDGSRVLALTGATGFLGGRIAALASTRGWRVRALQRQTGQTPKGVSEVIAGNLADSAALQRLVQGADAIIHNAGLVRASSPRAFMAANALGANAVAIAARQAGDAPFLLISSLAARRPDISAYAASKAVAEAGLRRILVGKPLAILRPPAIYGPADAATKPLFQAIARGWAPMLGPANVRFSMIYVDDAAEAALAALDAGSPAAPLFEIDDGAGGHDWPGVRAAAEAAAGRRLRPLRLPGLLLSAAAAAGGAVARISEPLGFKPPFLTPGKRAEMCAGDWIADPMHALPNWHAEVSLEAGFRRTLAWYKGH